MDLGFDLLRLLTDAQRQRTLINGTAPPNFATRVVPKLGQEEVPGDHELGFDNYVITDEDREVLRVFLSSRGNMKDLERHLGVSYPTARARFDALLGRLGIDRAPALPAAGRVELMEQVAKGEIDVDEALRRLNERG